MTVRFLMGFCAHVQQSEEYQMAIARSLEDSKAVRHPTGSDDILGVEGVYAQ